MNWAFFAIMAAIFTALAAIVEKKTLIKQHAMEFAATLALFNVLIIIPLIPTANFDMPLKILFFIFIASILGATAFLFFAKGMRHSEVSFTSSLLNFRPAMTFLLAFMFLKERLNMYQGAGLLLLVVGAYTLEMNHTREGIFEPFKILIKSKPAHYIFVAVILYSFSSILDKVILNQISPSTYIVIVHFFIAIILLFYLSLFHDGIMGITHGIKTSWKWIAIVALFTTTYRLFQAQAISMANVSLVSPIKHTAAFFTILIGGKLFHEQNLKQKMIAATIMVAGAALLIVG